MRCRCGDERRLPIGERAGHGSELNYVRKALHRIVNRHIEVYMAKLLDGRLFARIIISGTPP